MSNENFREGMERAKKELIQTSGVDQSLLDELYATIEGLRQGNVLLRRLFEANVIGIVIGQLGMALIDANDLALRGLGYTREDLRHGNLLWDRILPKESLSTLQRMMEELEAFGVSSPTEVDVIRKDNSHARVLIGSARLEGSDRIASFLIDMTIQRQTERALRESEQQMRAIVETIPDMIFRIDNYGEIRDIPSAAGHEAKIDSALFVGRPLSELVPPPIATRGLELIGEALRSGQIQMFEFEFPTSRGITYFEARIAPSGESEVIAIVRNVTERAIAEAAIQGNARRFQALIERSWDAVALLDITGRIVYASPAATRILGYSSDELMGCDPFASIYPEDRAPVMDTFARLLAESGKSVTVQYRQRRRDGALIWIESTGTNLLHESSVDAVVMNFRDITASKQAEIATRQARDAAEAANFAKDQFLAILSHELRTPLAPVLSAVQLLETEPDLSHDARACIDIIHRNIDLEVRLIDDLLDLTRIARGKIDLTMSVVDVHDLIIRAVEFAKGDVGGKDVDVKLELHAGSFHVNADPARLQQVFWNIVKNAIKFTPSGGEVMIRTSNAPGGWLTVEVVDTGIGIEHTNLARIFNPFDQGEQTITKRFGGLGLGLAICKTLVELHGGEIGAYSDGLNHGATFTVRLATVSEG